MPRWAVVGLRWVLPFAATALLLGGIRTQTLAALPLAVVALAVWLAVLPKPLKRP